MNDFGTAFLVRDYRKNDKRRTPRWKRWMGSPEWFAHAAACRDPYCSLLWHPFGACGIRMPARSGSRARAVRSARRMERYYRKHPLLKWTGPVYKGCVSQMSLPVAHDWRPRLIEKDGA